MRYASHEEFVRRFDAPLPGPIEGPRTLADARRQALVRLLDEAWSAGGAAAWDASEGADSQTFDEWVAERLGRDWAAVESSLFLNP